MIQYAVFEKEEDWLEFRAPYFTASEVSKLMTEPKNKSEVISVGAKTYVRKCAVSKLAPSPPPQYNSAMEHGKITEPMAVTAFEKSYKKSRDDVDFIYTSDNGILFFYDDEHNLGGTPDILVREKYCVEIKCPNSDTHLEYLMMSTPEDVKNTVPQYYGQMQTNMYLTQTDECIFMSFDDRFYNEKLHAHFITVPRDEEYIERLLAKAKHAKEYKNRILELLEEPQTVFVND